MLVCYRHGSSAGVLRLHFKQVGVRVEVLLRERQVAGIYQASGYDGKPDLKERMYLRKEGGSGYNSRNPYYHGPPDARIEEELSNGQHDFYPASWALPIAEVSRMLDHFR